ncbi:MAG: arsenate reductase (glutaredoxin) [Deltaproteobacteria bacterium]|nr:arsenate reductase (glutaredoxin) [Deltaproteobacteria bacterium]
MLDEKKIAYRYREYTEEPLSAEELKAVLAKLGLGPKDLLRKNDKAYKELGLTGKEADGKLIKLMAEHPTLLQRPIGVKGRKAVVGRPIENLLEF